MQGKGAEFCPAPAHSHVRIGEGTMQETETVIGTRLRRVARVVPTEPLLRYWRYYFIAGTLALLFFVISASFAFNAIRENRPLSAYTILWNHSLLSIVAFYYIVRFAALLFSFSPWIALDKRRQQAARYTLIVGERAKIAEASGSDTPALPDSFVIFARRHWLATGIVAVVDSLFFSLVGAIVYSYWQDMLPVLQQGVPFVLFLLVNALNIAILLMLAMSVFRTLIFSPREYIIATRDGLTCRRGWRTVTIPWQQARLFAVIGQSEGKRGSVLFYELASKDALIRWPSTGQQVRPGTPGWHCVIQQYPGAASFCRRVSPPGAVSQ